MTQHARVEIARLSAQFVLAVLGVSLTLFGFHLYNERIDRLHSEASVRARLLTYLDETSTGLIEATDGKRIRTATKPACAIFGYEYGELNGKSMDVLLPSWFAEEHDKKMKAAVATMKASNIKTHVSTMRCIAVKKDGSEFEILVRVFVADDGILAIVNRASDLTYSVMKSDGDTKHVLTGEGWAPQQ